MARAALLAGDRARLDTLAAALGDGFERASVLVGEVGAPEFDALPPLDAAVVWLDANAGRRSAVRLRARFVQLPIVLVAEAGAAAALRTEVSIDPHLGQPLAVIACEGLDRLQAVVGDLVQTGRERRGARLAADAANALLAPGSASASVRGFANAVVDRVPLGVVLLDGDGEVRFANAWAMGELSHGDGRSGGPVPLLPDVADYLRRWCRSPAAGEIGTTSEAWLMNSHGVPRSYLVSCVDAGSAPASRLVTIQDITERLEIEAERRRFERADMVASVCAGVNHHMNNTLSVIMGHAELLAEGVPRGQSKHLDQIIRSVQRAGRINHSLLTYIGEHIEPAQAVDCDTLVRDLVETFVAGDHPIELTVAGTGLVVKVVSRLLQLSLTNLLQNAVEASPPGGAIQVWLGRDPASPDRIVIAVTDHGSGFAPGDAERAYDPFFTTKGLASHMGLGLSTVMGLARQAGGRVEIDSVPGEGATVRLELPAAPAPRAGG